jgi:hypothetical protein
MLDEHTADRILSGLVAPADAPPGYAEVTRLVLGLRELAGRPAPDLSRRLPVSPPAPAEALPRRAYLAAALAGGGLAMAALRLWSVRPG